MPEARVLVFFYGSYMNLAVLAEAGLAPKLWEVASLPGFDIRIAPRANLVRSPQEIVFGVMAEATHAELDRLYAHARNVLGETYLPEAVLVHTRSGGWHPALCYIAPRWSSAIRSRCTSTGSCSLHASSAFRPGTWRGSSVCGPAADELLLFA